ncbi:MAG TPA: ROK family protein [Kofleriaceae bacterium]
MTMIGIDLGGTNLRAAAIEGEATLRDNLREPVGEPRDPETIVERCAVLCEQLSAGQPASVGVGIAAMLRDRQGMVANSPYLRWRDVAFGQLLARRLGSRFKLGIYNDVNAIVYGEAAAGAARNFRDVLGVYVGTGIGGGLIVNGQLVEGASNCAGEIGHTKVRWDDKAAPCACGSRGCIEAYCGGDNIQRRIVKELAAGAKTSAIRHAGGTPGGIEHVNPGHVDMAAADGDDWALGLWTELAPLLAVTLGNAVALLNPDRLVLGGGVLGRCPTLYTMVTATLMVAGNAASLEPMSIAQAELGDDAGIVGAAHLAARDVSLVTA